MGNINNSTGFHEHHTHNHECDCHSHERKEIVLSDTEKSILLEIEKFNCLPISRFIMCSSTESEIRFVGLPAVFINSLDESMENVKKFGGILSRLEEHDLISLDYDMPIRGFNYDNYTNSELYLYFKETVKEGRKNPAFLCDTAEIELGSMALTEYGVEILK